MAYLANMFSYTFMVRALIVGLLVSLCAALLGVSLVLKRYSMIGDGLSHVGFGALAVASVLGASELGVAIPVVVVAALAQIDKNFGKGTVMRLGDRPEMNVEAIPTGSLALGVLVISVTSGMNTDVMNFLFGSILAMSQSDVTLSIILSACVLTLFVLFYCRMFAVTFDEGFARATGANAGLYNTLLACLTAVTIVLGMRMMGALLISSLIIFPPLTSMRLCKTFRSVVICSGLLSSFCFVAGMVISFALSTPTGPSVVAVNIICFCVFAALGRARALKMTARRANIR